jgi:hypothetical protein
MPSNKSGVGTGALLPAHGRLAAEDVGRSNIWPTSAGLKNLEVFSGRLSRPPILNDLVADFLAFLQSGETRTLNSRYVDEGVG